jgi:hypothetical protein
MNLGKKKGGFGEVKKLIKFRLKSSSEYQSTQD